MEKLKELRERVEELKLKKDNMLEAILILDEIITEYPEQSKLLLDKYEGLKDAKLILDMCKLSSLLKGTSYKDELKKSYEEYMKSKEVDKNDTVENFKTDAPCTDNQCDAKEEVPMEEKVAKLPDGCKLLISYVYDDIKTQTYNKIDRCFMSIKPNRDGEICIYPDTILKLEKDLEKEKGYKNVKVINLVELD